MIIRRTQNKFGIKKDGAWQKKQFSIWEFFAAMGFILGTALAVCVIFLKFTFDDRPRKPQDIEVSAGIPTLAIVPKSKV